MNKSYISELQKMSLVLFLANRGVCNIFADNEGDKHSYSSSPFTKAWFLDHTHRIHVRHFGRIWRLLKKRDTEATSRTALEAYSLYVSDCLLELQSAPVLTLVQGWVLIEAYEKCLACSDRCEPACCFGEQSAPSLLEKYIYQLCFEPGLQLESGLLKQACLVSWNNSYLLNKTQQLSD
ncbi:FlhC family transcriptional regulator [Kosakonia sacchari]|uniref:FlhC family transcriptional regulator n=1 Tax=Kosakonia sacchari TaxID=1158459 RepID=UPI0030C01EDC